MKRTVIVLIACLSIVATGCAPRYQTVTLAPRVDLTEHQIIAVVEFDSSTQGELGPLATRRFTDLARRDQGLVRMMNVDLDTDERNQAAFKELGKRHDARTILVGTVNISDIRPNLSISRTLRSGTLTANVDATLTVDLIESATGASIWSASARTSSTVGHISVFEGKNFAFDAEDPEQAYGALIDTLVTRVTSDFRSRRVRRPIAR
jgi:hypothetical protein